MNFTEVVKEFTAQNALLQLPKTPESEVVGTLAAVFSTLLKDDEKRQNLAKNAFAVMKKNRGATSKTIEYMKTIILPSK